MEGKAFGLVDGGGGGLGAEKVAAEHRVDGNIGKAAAEGPQLAIAPGRDGAVVLAVGHPVEIALRLGVADEIDGRHMDSLPVPKNSVSNYSAKFVTAQGG